MNFEQQEGLERGSVLNTTSQCLLSLPPLPPLPEGAGLFQTKLSRPVGVALPQRRAVNPVMETEQPEEQDLSKVTLKQLPPKQDDLTPNFLKSYTNSESSDDENELSLLPSSPSTAHHAHTPAHHYQLPHDKTHHIFITHSTSDEHFIRHKLVVPLTEPPNHFNVICSIDFIEGGTYNNDAIKAAMQQSCVIMIGISPAYINSERCQREWRKSVEFTSHIIVLALSQCSRPERIKRFLYLDFMDDSKRATVWQKLMDETSKFIKEANKSSNARSNEDMAQLFNEYESQETTNSNSNKYNTGSKDTGALGNVDGMQQHSSTQHWVEDEDESSLHKAKAIDTETIADQVISSDDGSTSGSDDDDPSGGREGTVLDYQREEGELSDTGSLADEPSHPKYSKIDNEPDDQQLDPSVKGFYNKLAEPGADNRDESPIFYMRNFNNWVKSVLIRQYLWRSGATVLDLCCGKGGDLNKWKEGRIEHLVCADISEVSIERCKERYHSRKMTFKGRPVFSAEFIVADCCQVRLRERYKNQAKRFHIASCQFSLHYSFESYEKAMVMLQNACENLLPDGYFLGTTVDSNELVRRLRQNGHQDEETGSWMVGNEVYSVTLDSDIDPCDDNLPLFNCKYHFKLEGVVNVPEYLIHFPLLVKLLNSFGMQEVLHQNFYDFFHEHRHVPEDVQLMYNMSAFNKKTGTMSEAQWEAIGLYLVFVFQKKSP